jgi:hypothetical protein
MTPASGQIIELLQLRGSLPCKTYLMVWHFENEQKTKTQKKKHTDTDTETQNSARCSIARGRCLHPDSICELTILPAVEKQATRKTTQKKEK